MDKNKKVRVRFAPSPTGRLHVGGARTALFNFLFAKKSGGEYLLRIEDTDEKRSKVEYTEDILAGLRYLGIQWDESIVYQSSRFESHRAAALKLLDEGKAYRCFCQAISERDVDYKERFTTKYPGTCRNLTVEETKAKIAAGNKFAVRFKVTDEVVTFNDGVHGEIKVDCSEIEDFVILRQNGSPTYMLAVTVDDMEMGITYVIRGNDHISNTPKQLLLHRALGNEPPHYAHVPLILGNDKKRLSKRHGAESVLTYWEMGIPGEALANYLALLGWNPGGDQEIMSLVEIADKFSVEGISPRSAVFEQDKLLWFSGKHISMMNEEELKILFRSWLSSVNNIKVTDEEYVFKTLLLSQSRIHYFAELFEEYDYYFHDPEEYDADGAGKHFKFEGLKEKLRELNKRLMNDIIFDAVTVEKTIRDYAVETGISAGKIIHPVRLALTGKTSSPGLFELMELLGKETTVRRIGRVIDKLKSEDE